MGARPRTRLRLGGALALLWSRRPPTILRQPQRMDPRPARRIEHGLRYRICSQLRSQVLLFRGTTLTSEHRVGHNTQGVSLTILLISFRPADQTAASIAETTPLPNHLYSRGLLSGRHSDITVVAFGTKYPLHRLLLDRAPFFYSAFSEPWRESSAKEITLHPEDVDPNITQAAFELALKRLYGCHRVEEEDKEAIGLFATGCWLEMIDLIEASINSLLRQMCPANLSSYIRFVTSSYYGKNGDRVLAAAKAMLCREGYEMPLRYFDGIPGDIIREIVGSDGFYVPDEWERWILTQRIFNRRLKAKAIEIGLLDLDGTLKTARPKGMNFMAVRFDTVYRNSLGAVNAGMSDDMDEWLGIYTCPDIAPLLVLLDEGIHYVHLGFEQLQIIREQHDVLGLPLLPEKIISNALWTAMELRQRVVNARKSDMELGLSQVAEFSEEDELLETPISAGLDTPATNVEMSEKAAGKQVATEEDELRDEEQVVSGSWDGNGQPRKFWIPQVDATYILGGDLEPVSTASPTVPRSRHVARISASLDPQDAQWATDFASSAQDRPETPPNQPSLDTTDSPSSQAPPPQAAYSHYPPFRFAAEFPSLRSLKDHKRVYSHTVWYAGSQWNIYLQKKETAKHTQLGVYLHRERPNIDGINANGDDPSLVGIMQSSVDERIGHLERELIMRGPPRSRARNMTDPAPYDSHTRDVSAENASRGGGGGTSHDLDTLSGLLRNQTAEPGRASTRLIPRANLPLDRRPTGPNPDYDTRHASAHALDENDDDGGFASAAALAASGGGRARRVRYPALPPYVDRRASIRTYFKIYTPSKGGRVLSVYESTPDDSFPFGQSFGWKSKDLIMDDGFGPGGGGGASEGTARPKEPRLRFMVVLGRSVRLWNGRKLT